MRKIINRFNKRANNHISRMKQPNSPQQSSLQGKTISNNNTAKPQRRISTQVKHQIHNVYVGGVNPIPNTKLLRWQPDPIITYHTTDTRSSIPTHTVIPNKQPSMTEIYIIVDKRTNTHNSLRKDEHKQDVTDILIS